MSKFIKVNCKGISGETLINIDSISAVFIEENTIVINGNDYDAKGIMSFDDENFRKILKAIKKIR